MSTDTTTPDTSPLGVLKSSIESALSTDSDTSTSDKNSQAAKDRQTMATNIANAIEKYLTTRQITLNFTTATLSTPSGTLTVTGSTTGTIS